MESRVSDVELTCSAEIGEHDALSVRYQITSHATTEIYVYNRTLQNQETHAPDLVCDAGDDTVNLIVGISPLPVDFSVFWKYHPKTTKLSPGQSSQDHFVLATPLWEQSTYHPSGYEARAQVEVDRVRVIVDFIRPSAEGFTLEVGKDGTPSPRGAAESVACVCKLPRRIKLWRHLPNKEAEYNQRSFERRGTSIL